MLELEVIAPTFQYLTLTFWLLYSTYDADSCIALPKVSCLLDAFIVIN